MADPASAALLAWLREREGDMARLLERVAVAESPTSAPETHTAVLEILGDELEDLDFRVRFVVAGANVHLYARPRRRTSRAPRQLLVGHADTVWPAGTLERMPVRINNGRLYGPGVYDMKGGLVQLVFALRALRHFGIGTPATPVVFVNTDEEGGSLSSSRYLRLLAADAERAFVLEPSWGPSGRLKTGRKGAGRFRLVVRGKAAHAGSGHDAGASAILELSHQVQRLFALNDPERGVTVNVGTIDGGLEPNVVAPEASAIVDVRALTLEDANEVETELRALQPIGKGLSLAVEGSFGRLPMQPTSRNRDLWKLAQERGRALGLDLSEATAVGGASDGNTTSAYTATLDGLGAVGDGAHALNEHVVLARMPERAALLALLLAAPLSAKSPTSALATAEPAPASDRRPMRGAIHSSVTRIARLERKATSYLPIPRREWETGDYVVGELLDGGYEIETESGRPVEALAGDFIVGALGRRYATLEATGDWERIGDDLRMEGLTRAGVFGKCTSIAPAVMRFLAPLRYRGHVLVNGRRSRMKDHVEPVPERDFRTPTVLVVGTSMDAGKTTSAKRIIRILKRHGLRVGGAKLTGVARYGDILGMRDAGADVVLDFVDAGLPSTICPGDEFRTAVRRLLSLLAAAEPDVAVVEAGASPLEPYNGDLAIEELSPAVRCRVLCASDPYAVVGVMAAFGFEPDLVCGRATSTEAGIALVRKLAAVPALDLLDAEVEADLEQLILEKLELG
jgi:glutamate carboxypeptidase